MSDTREFNAALELDWALFVQQMESAPDWQGLEPDTKELALSLGKIAFGAGWNAKIPPLPQPEVPGVREEINKLRRCLGFFASVIKSGEPWTETCQAEYDKALDISSFLVAQKPVVTTDSREFAQQLRKLKPEWAGPFIEYHELSREEAAQLAETVFSQIRQEAVGLWREAFTGDPEPELWTVAWLEGQMRWLRNVEIAYDKGEDLAPFFEDWESNHQAWSILERLCVEVRALLKGDGK